MNQIHEIDLDDRTVHRRPGHQHAEAERGAAPHGVIYPDDPASYPCSLVGGRIGTSGWSLIGARYGHTRDLVISASRSCCRPARSSASATAAAGRSARARPATSSSSCSWATRARSASSPRRRWSWCREPEAEFSAFLACSDYDDRVAGDRRARALRLATLAGVVLFDERKVAYLRRDDEAYIPQPDWTSGGRRVALYGNEAEVRPAAKRSCGSRRRRAASTSATRSPQGDWAARHDRYATPLHGRTPDGQVAPMSWHCEDAAIPYPKVPEVREQWHAIVERPGRAAPIFDDWGMFAYTSGRTSRGATT